MTTLFSRAWMRFLLVSALAVPALTQVRKAAGSPLASDQGPRAISSITIAERQTLPDSTMVKLKSGRVASLGTLRAEHRARMERFSRAAALGQAIAVKLAAHAPNVVPSRPPTTASARPTPSTATKSGQTTAEQVRANGLVGRVELLSDTFVRFQMPTYSGLSVPKDYADFCKAANPSVCIYFPANTTFIVQGASGSSTFVLDEDPLITDYAICHYDGGEIAYHPPSVPPGPDPCLFYYPVNNVVAFMPSGPISTKESCDPPAKYVFDPKGAVQVSYPYSSSTFATGGATVTCVAQVWVGK